MNKSMIKKTLLASAIAMSIASTQAIAIPDQLPITGMAFDGKVYTAGGFFNVSKTIGPFDPNTDLVNDPNPPRGEGGRMLAPGFDPLTASGNIFSFDDFTENPWEGLQQTLYLKNTDSWAFVYDKAASPPLDPNATPPTSPCDAPVNVTKSTGSCSVRGSYDYDANLAGMSDEQVAVGMFFTWNGNEQIPVLDIFNCDANDSCTGTGIPMQTQPFLNSKARFNPALSCNADFFSSTGIDTPVAIDIIVDVLGNESTPANCVNPTAVAPKNNPAGLRVDSVVSPTAGGGTVVVNGSVVDYTPAAGFEGPDTFVINITDDTGQTTAITFSVQVGGELQNNFTMMGKSGGRFGGTNDVEFEWDGSSFNSNAVDGAGILAAIDFGAHVTIGSPNPFLNETWTSHHIRIFEGPGTFKFDVTCKALADYDNGMIDCDRPLAEQGAKTRFMTMTLEAGEIGGHMLFDWGSVSALTDCGKANCDIDVVQTWKRNEFWNTYGDTSPKNALWIGAAGVTPASIENTPPGQDPARWELVSTDVKGYTDAAGVVHAEGNNINGAPMLDGAFIDNYANFNKTPDKAGGEFIPPPEPPISDVGVDGFSFSLWTLLAGLFSVLGLRRVNRSK